MTAITLALRPATLDRESALQYTGLSEAELRRHEEKGTIVFKPLGKSGTKVVPTDHLDALIASIWAEETNTPDEDMDCGDD